MADVTAVPGTSYLSTDGDQCDVMQQLEMKDNNAKDGTLVIRCWPHLRQHVTSLLRMQTVDFVLGREAKHSPPAYFGLTSIRLDSL
ncbi:hypothetical protein KC340_g57 [Hortaea werneckii]|nr:hypothetical protein KC340_g57 [Hortaea werneckii]